MFYRVSSFTRLHGSPIRAEDIRPCSRMEQEDMDSVTGSTPRQAAVKFAGYSNLRNVGTKPVRTFPNGRGWLFTAEGGFLRGDRFIEVYAD